MPRAEWPCPWESNGPTSWAPRNLSRYLGTRSSFIPCPFANLWFQSLNLRLKKAPAHSPCALWRVPVAQVHVGPMGRRLGLAAPTFLGPRGLHGGGPVIGQDQRGSSFRMPGQKLLLGARQQSGPWKWCFRGARISELREKAGPGDRWSQQTEAGPTPDSQKHTMLAEASRSPVSRLMLQKRGEQ